MNDLPFYAVLGHPIAHSRSPRIHAALAAQTQRPLRYEAIEVPLDGLAGTLQRLRAQGLQGCNITLPFKPEALALAATVSERARRAGAANTLGWDAQGRLWADNTDGQGLVNDLLQRAGFELKGRHLLILGAGGAVAGCLAPLIDAGPASITLSNRSADKALALIERHTDLGLPLHTLPWGAAPARGFDGVINGTSAALGGGQLQLPPGLCAPGAWALDMVYGSAAAGFLQAAQAQGARVRDGLGMLVEQAALAFEAWQGLRPDTAAVFATLRAELPQAC